MTTHKWHGDGGAAPLTGNESLSVITQTKLPESLYVLQTSGSVKVREAAIAATLQEYVPTWKHRVQITQLVIVSDTATTGSDGSNNYAFQLHNLTDTADLFAAAPTTEGAEIVADGVRKFTPDQNTVLEADDVLELQVTKNGSPTDLSSARVMVVVHFKPVGDA